MFDRIARRYDLVNTVLSVGIDGGWRRRAARMTQLKAGGSALDVACGSGKLTALLARIAGPDGRVVGLDFSTQMLEVARHDHPAMKFWEGDALNLPFEDASFDASTIAFGLRNLADPVRGLREMLRVVKPGGRAVVLEFVRPPKGPIGMAYRVYLKTLLPAIGGALSGQRSAYSYLSQSIDSYRSADELRALAEVAGWKGVRYASMGAGTVGLMSGGSIDR
jgi:demethylmenaquinone methyltransferase / 2-methoxy-6-polyprenyl-1,4-benzoquinol methylase